MNKMKFFLPSALLIASVGLMHAAVIETLSIDLSPLHAGSLLQGSVTLASPPMPGDSTPIALSFTDPADYSPTSLMGTLVFGNGIGANITFRFSTLTFTNLANNATVNFVGEGSRAVRGGAVQSAGSSVSGDRAMAGS